MKTTRPTLRSKLLNALLMPTVVAITLTVMGAVLFGWLNYRNTIERTREDLSTKVVLAARRVSAEFLIGIRGAPDTVADGLGTELGVNQIHVIRSKSPCTPRGSNGVCDVLESNQLSVVTKVPGLSEDIFVSASNSAPTLKGSIPFEFLLWAGVPIFIVIGLAAYIQQRLLRRYFLRPIESIIGKTTSGAETPKHWPSEFVKLHAELDDTFQKRDQALIGQITSGVIHDLKTLLQPISGAAQLASEATEAARRENALDMLLRASQRNLPKMQSMLESVLDGNREIRIQSRAVNLTETIRSAIKNAKDAADSSSSVTIETAFNGDDPPVRHDPAQMERALTNLIKNGIEASALSKDEKRVRISLQRESSNQFHIVVDDSGSGLPMPFEQLLVSRRSTKLRGTGLGLLISQKIIEAHHGTLHGAKSPSFAGARFTVTLGGDGP